MNYFELYEIEESLVIDSKLAKKKFLELSRKYHPDFNSNENEERQEEVLELSTLNTNAFNTFKKEIKTIEYVLNLHGLLGDDVKNKLAPDFLMEMMDINEQLMELEFDFEESVYSKIKTAIANLESEIKKDIESDIIGYELQNVDEKEQSLLKVKDYYLKNKYLLRIKETLDKFALRL